jgi:hemerythrin-like domain-containing protein
LQVTQILMDEHLLIERVLSALQDGAERVVKGEEMRPAFFLNAALFMKNFTDTCHHRKEEGALFVAMNESGLPVQDGSIGTLLAEHKQGRIFTLAMKYAAQQWEKGDDSARAAVVQIAFFNVALFHQHIHKENNILFPMVDNLIIPDRQEEVVADFERIDHEEVGQGFHEKYLALVEVLEKESRMQI